MKKKICALILILNTVFLFAFEGGGLIKTGIGFDIAPSKLKDIAPSIVLHHYDGISLWARQNMDTEGNFNFNIQASYLFNVGKWLRPVNTKASLNHILDIDLLKFSFLLPFQNNSLLLEFGRYGLADITGIIFDQKIDGFFVSYKRSDVSLVFNLGYTGLLNAYTSSINADNSAKYTKLYRLSPSFFQLTGLAQIPLGKQKHILSFELDSFIETKSKGITKNYFTVQANGPIAPGLFFLLSTSGVLLSRSDKVQGGIALNGELNYYFAKYGARIGGKTQWFSGGKIPFETFSLKSASQTNFIPYSNLWKTSLMLSIKPVSGLFLATDFGIFCKGLHKHGKELYKGFEWNASLGYTLFTDIFLGFNTGLFVDNNTNIKSRIGFRGTISF